jgi:hypothetical protein
MDTVVRPKQVIWWPNLVIGGRRRRPSELKPGGPIFQANYNIHSLETVRKNSRVKE